MSGDNDQVIEQTAREMGWVPQEEFRGDASKWVDAKLFVSRGENFIPILRADRDKFRQKTSELEAALQENTRLLKASQEAIEALKEHQTAAAKQQVAQARKDVIAQIAAARESGDVASEVALQDQLSELRAAEKATPGKPASAPAPAPATPPPPDPTLSAWIAANPWFNESPRKRALALGVADEIRAANPGTVGRAFFDKLDAELAKEPQFAPPASKVDGGRTSGTGGSSGKGRGYADLPADAKEICLRQSEKLVGPGRAFKTLAEWQAHYAQQVFGD